DVSGTVTVTDTLPAGMSFGSASGASCTPAGQTVVCTLPALTAGGVASFTITVHVAPSATGSLTNFVTVGSDTPDPDAANSTTSDAVTVVRSADLEIAKSHTGT